MPSATPLLRNASPPTGRKTSPSKSERPLTEWLRFRAVAHAAGRGVEKDTDAYYDLTGPPGGFILPGESEEARRRLCFDDIMRLNGHLAELRNDFEAYGEYLYWLTLMGEPSATEPWGWQLEGHHLIVNCLVLADQLVVTPMFMGSEPVVAETGRYSGTAVLQAEQDLSKREQEWAEAGTILTLIEAGTRPEEIAAMRRGSYKVVKVNIDEERELSERYEESEEADFVAQAGEESDGQVVLAADLDRIAVPARRRP